MTRTPIKTSVLLTVASGAACCVALLVVDPAGAVSTRSFLLDDAESLAAGELEGTAVLSTGMVVTSAEVRRIDLGEVPVAYSLARARDGSVYIGTGNEGKVLKLSGDTVTEVATTGQLMVASLAVGPDGTVYAGTMPEGRIYAISPGGELRELVRPENAEHVWALAYDERRRTLFAATGPEGKVFAINAAGQAQVYFDSEATHVMCLALDEDGTLYAGTSDEARVYRLRGPGQAEVVYDFPGNEITALAVRDGTLAVAANEFPEPPRVTGTTKTTSTSRPSRPRPGKGRLWRVGSDGRAEQVFSNDGGQLTAVQIAEDGSVYAAAGTEGRIYKVMPDHTSATWIDVDERQVLAIDLVGRDPVFVTGDVGAVYRVVPGRPRSAIWTSKVLDAGFNAHWGQLSWRGDGTIQVQTRSGNTSEPDASWSEWSTAITTPGPTRSPAARFIQVRARFERDPDAVIRAVRLFYLPQNQRAVVHDIGIKPPKNSNSKNKNKSPDKLPEPSSQYKLQWKVDNPDEDELRYRLRFREEGQEVWRDILREDQVQTEAEYTWETEGIPDAWYVIQVEASDEVSNPPELTLRAVGQSEPLLIDNHAPVVEGLRYQNGRVTGRARDGLGPIARISFAVDSGQWSLVFPTDGFLDTADERFEIDPGTLDPGPHVVAVRAVDAGGNIGSAEVSIRVPGRARP